MTHEEWWDYAWQGQGTISRFSLPIQREKFKMFTTVLIWTPNYCSTHGNCPRHADYKAFGVGNRA
jgi:hypothetical protein